MDVNQRIVRGAKKSWAPPHQKAEEQHGNNLRIYAQYHDIVINICDDRSGGFELYISNPTGACHCRGELVQAPKPSSYAEALKLHKGTGLRRKLILVEGALSAGAANLLGPNFLRPDRE